MGITLRNNTNYAAVFSVRQADLVILNWRVLEANQLQEIKTGMPAMIQATTSLGNVDYSSESMTLNHAAGYVAQLVQDIEKKTYQLNVFQIGNTEPNVVQLYKTCTPPVIFTLRCEEQFEQTVIVDKSLVPARLTTSGPYFIDIVVNGITIPTVSSELANPTITVITEVDNPEAGFYRVEVS
ncbi:MAG: hypothetical protein KGM99_00410 [Burkholderiales bacterium]|nr:hypothetical protein [Burkholderiales bacterium]